MNYQYAPYFWLLGLSFTILMSLALVSLRYRRVKGSKAFGVCMLNFAFWTLCNGFELAATDLPTKLFWANMQYFSYTTFHLCWLYMVLQFTGSREWTRPARFLPLFIIPVILIILVWTDQYHGLIRYNFSLNTDGTIWVIEKTYGPLYWIHPIYTYSIVLISIVLIARAALIHRSIYRMQAIALLISPVVSFIPSIMYVLSWSPVQGFDITPAILGVSGLIAAVGLFRYRLFAVAPVARDTAVDHMNMGMLVIDSDEMIVDTNSVACKLLEKEGSQLAGLSAREGLSSFGISWEELQAMQTTEHQVFSTQMNKELYLELQCHPVFNKYSAHVGHVILVRDVTEIKDAQLRLLEQSRQLATSKERERLARDLHDNLGQVLGFINMQAQGIGKELQEAGVKTSSTNLTKLVEATQAAHRDIRDHIQVARTASGLEKDFFAAIKQEVEQFEKRVEKKVDLQVNGKSSWEKLTSLQKINIWYIVKEALHNVEKHAATAQHVSLSFVAEKQYLSVEIRDDGEGFNLLKHGSRGDSGKYGLKIMEERALEMGARLRLESCPAKGTTIQLLIPADKGGTEDAFKGFAG